ncbi:MAG: YjbQ family protein [Lentisphaerae bacterium]|nr:YjbQ family protein [Lentisphaerota bacterium]
MAEVAVYSNRDCELIDITGKINALIPEDLECGICHIFCQHTTAGLTINENADPDVRHDLLKKLDALIPKNESYYRHGEGNSAAHLKSSLMGVSLAVPVRNGRLHLGTWQGVYFCEFDGPRSRQVEVVFQTAESRRK